MKYDIKKITSSEGQSFDNMFKIYADSLPISEQKNRDGIASIVDRDDYYVFGLYNASILLGFSILFMADNQSIALLEYMATSVKWRNMGIGANIFRFNTKIVGDRPMLVEVDSDRELAKDHAIRVRRKNFYRRLGCRQLEGIFYLLPLSGEERTPVMDLLLYANKPKKCVRLSTVQSWLETIYVSVYGQQKDDVRIEEMLANAPDPVPII